MMTNSCISNCEKLFQDLEFHNVVVETVNIDLTLLTDFKISKLNGFQNFKFNGFQKFKFNGFQNFKFQPILKFQTLTIF